MKRCFKDKRVTKESLEIFILGQNFLSVKPQVILCKNTPYDKDPCLETLLESPFYLFPS